MLTNVPLRDFKNFKPDVVICPHCTQHLMGVRDIHWGANKVDFTYGCDGCGHELDKTIAEGAAPTPATCAPAVAEPATPPAVSVVQEAPAPAPAVEDLVPFPFRPATPTPPSAKSEPAATKTERSTYVPRQTFIEDRATRTPRQVFDEKRPALEPRPAIELDKPPVASRASLLLRDVAIFDL
jgi:hypothetical protein